MVAPRTATGGYVGRDNLQRVRLLTLGRREVEYVDRLNARIIIDEHIKCGLSEDAVKAALGALSLALRLSCLGKGSRRGGLGCLDITRVYGRYSSLFDPGRRINDVIDEVIKYVSSVVSGRRFTNVARRERGGLANYRQCR